MTNSSGTKFDTTKLRFDLISYIAIAELVKALEFGAKKYGDNNWRKGFFYTRLIGAVLRHSFLYLSGEQFDLESGLSHMAHVMATAMFLLELEVTRPDLDDRYKTSSDATNKHIECPSISKPINLKN